MCPSLFADDTNLFAFSRNTIELETCCAIDLKAVDSWFRDHYLTPNASKSLSLPFISPALKARRSFHFPCLEFHGELLQTCASTKFLGVNLNSSLSWTGHVSQLHKKLARFSGLFYLSY
eukprot:Pompholyxophrys_punicea_v1_NODE_809_length_1265_cov_12.676033.p1 type:complete len:119 gc:universal NODE_809_length_1265_cov_12.676033:405-49(-)